VPRCRSTWFGENCVGSTPLTSEQLRQTRSAVRASHQCRLMLHKAHVQPRRFGTLGSLPSAIYDVRKRYADGRPAAVLFMGSVEVAGLSCRGEAWFNRKGELVAATLSREQPVGGRRFGAGCFVRYYRSQEDGRVADVKLAEDQEVDGLPCRAGKLVTFDRKQRLSFLELTTDWEIEGVPCAGGHHVEFQDGRLSAAILATHHVLIDRRFPRGTYVDFVKGHLRSVLLQEDWDINGIPVQAGSTVEFYENGRPRTMVLARSQLILGRRYEKGTLLQFDRDGQLVYAQPSGK
jgi:hypothetical protein